ncbi:MAG: MBL fold metallo-hydrolase [bacterium]
MPVKVNFFSAGYCTHPEKIVIKGGSSKPVKFYATFVLIEHPEKGLILFDTGYSERFYTETKNFPFNIYAKITPVYFKEENSAVFQLKQLGINPNDIKLIILSHFHADHIGGVKDFPNAEFLCFKSAYEEIKGKKTLAAMKKGFLPGLLPGDFESRLKFADSLNKINISEEYSPFETGFDVFGDRSLIAVDVSGHSEGQLGLFISTGENTYFLVADACWLSKSYKEFILPHPIADIAFSCKKEYLNTLKKLHELSKKRPDINIMPSHCPEFLKKIIDKRGIDAE